MIPALTAMRIVAPTTHTNVARRSVRRMGSERSRGQIQLLLTDVVLKAGMNGANLAAKLQALRPAMKVIFMSGYNDALGASGGHTSDGAILLEKPFSTAVLRDKVRQLLDCAAEGMAARSGG